MAVTWYDTQILKIETLTDEVRRFWIENPGIQWQAGQFITFDLPIGEKRLQRWRSYSIANAPSGKAPIELCIVRNPDGAGTRYLFESAEVGSALRWKGPDGAFVLPSRLDHDLVMICTGTGLAPFRSMLQEIQLRDIPHRRIHLIFGTRTADSALYRGELELLARTMPGFRFDLVLSREPEWTGYKGYVHQVYQEHYAETRPDVRFMICGWSRMIDEAVVHLIAEMGYDRTQVQYELYG